MTPVYEALHRAGKTVIVATHGANLELLRHSPQVDHLLETPDPRDSLFAAARSLRRQLRQRNLRPCWALTAQQDARTRIGLLATLACAGRLGGFTEQPALYDRTLTYDRSLSRAGNNLRLAELVGADITACEPRVYFSPAQAEAARQLLPAAPVLAVVPGNSGGLPTAWHDDRWATVIRHAHDLLGYEVVYLGTGRDQPVIDRIQSLAGGIGMSLAGRTDIGTLAALLAQSDLCLSLMTGTLHVARAVGTPTVALGLAWEPPLEWMSPPQAHVRLLRGPELPRRPDYRCDDLTADRVMTETH